MNVALFASEVTVEVCYLVPYGTKKRAIAKQLSPVAHFHWKHIVGRYLLFGVLLLQEEPNATVLKL